MASLKPWTVCIYKDDGVFAVPERVTADDPLLSMNGSMPVKTYNVYAASQTGAIRAALMAAYQIGERDTVGKYELTLGESADLTLNRIAAEEGCTVGEILIRSINTYATLRKYRDSGVWVKERLSDPYKLESRLVVKRIAIP